MFAGQIWHTLHLSALREASLTRGLGGRRSAPLSPVKHPPPLPPPSPPSASLLSPPCPPPTIHHPRPCALTAALLTPPLRDNGSLSKKRRKKRGGRCHRIACLLTESLKAAPHKSKKEHNRHCFLQELLVPLKFPSSVPFSLSVFWRREWAKSEVEIFY